MKWDSKVPKPEMTPSEKKRKHTETSGTSKKNGQDGIADRIGYPETGRRTTLYEASELSIEGM